MEFSNFSNPWPFLDPQPQTLALKRRAWFPHADVAPCLCGQLSFLRLAVIGLLALGGGGSDALDLCGNPG